MKLTPEIFTRKTIIYQNENPGFLQKRVALLNKIISFIPLIRNSTLLTTDVISNHGIETTWYNHKYKYFIKIELSLYKNRMIIMIELESETKNRAIEFVRIRRIIKDIQNLSDINKIIDSINHIINIEEGG